VLLFRRFLKEGMAALALLELGLTCREGVGGGVRGPVFT
jgi:hypothetical protein